MPVLIQGIRSNRVASPARGDVDTAAVADRVKGDFVKKITNPFFSRCFWERVLDMEQSRVRNTVAASTWMRPRGMTVRSADPGQKLRTGRLSASSEREAGRQSAFLRVDERSTQTGSLRFAGVRFGFSTSEGSIESARCAGKMIAGKRRGEQHV